jgi:hypothetical protein
VTSRFLAWVLLLEFPLTESLLVLFDFLVVAVGWREQFQASRSKLVARSDHD